MGRVTLNNRNKIRGGSRVARFARAFTVRKLTAFLFVLTLGGSSAAKVGNGTPKQNAFRSQLAVALRNGGFDKFHQTFAMSTAAALVPGPDQEQMMALVCPPKALSLIGGFSSKVVYEAVPYATCLQSIADVAKLQTRLLSETQEYIVASLTSQEEKIKKEVSSQLALKNVEIAQTFDKAVEERVRAGLAEAQKTAINLKTQINNAKRNSEAASLAHKTNLNKAKAASKAAISAFEAAQKRDQEMRAKLWGFAGGLVDVLATPGAIFTSFKSFMSVFMVLVVVLAGFAGFGAVLFFVPGTKGLLMTILGRAKAGDTEGVKAACEKLKAEMEKEKAALEKKIKELTADLTSVRANRNAKIVNITNLTNQRNRLTKQLNNARRNLAAGTTNKNTIARLTRERNNLNRRLRNAQPSGAAAAVLRAVREPTPTNVNAALRRAGNARAANAVVTAVANPTRANVNTAVRAVAPPPQPPPTQKPKPKARNNNKPSILDQIRAGVQLKKVGNRKPTNQSKNNKKPENPMVAAMRDRRASMTSGNNNNF
jgi:hypothetical protein